jgi:hypothetical protein
LNASFLGDELVAHLVGPDASFDELFQQILFENKTYREKTKFNKSLLMESEEKGTLFTKVNSPARTLLLYMLEVNGSVDSLFPKI